ncbi:MAG: hypothetical protein AAF557_15085 [Pseudomonadota bacterium]
MLNEENKASHGQSIALLCLRVSLGMLLVWWGLAKIVKPAMGMKVQEKFYLDLFHSVDLQYAFGYVQVIVGLCVVLGFKRKFAIPAQLAITGFSALMILPALLDPFALYLPFKKLAGIQHLFYPTVIALCGAAVMITFRKQDRWNLDNVLENRKAAAEPAAA